MASSERRRRGFLARGEDGGEKRVQRVGGCLRLVSSQLVRAGCKLWRVDGDDGRRALGQEDQVEGLEIEDTFTLYAGDSV